VILVASLIVALLAETVAIVETVVIAADVTTVTADSIRTEMIAADVAAAASIARRFAVSAPTKISSWTIKISA
jgi:hypothetical protein